MVITSTVACSDDTTSGPVAVSLLVPDGKGHMVGGGLLNSDTTSVDVVSSTGSSIQAEKTLGGFVVQSSQSVVADHQHPVQFATAN